ncbi:ABC transporter ATP-binding protein [Mucilaginibacter paludis]|uniref:ABC transporter related protein n=1 Tax=Mucilaginibacter paludis DSM 18603 TaxID=714943 RepID=H1YDQ2_9SPHI|nr:ABC transporter ATP-binding protein [Mucilaginibacter paludis]EHQ30741.1 ABC transporter related protein [Mucilaginibacter paludis DSM 18603]
MIQIKDLNFGYTKKALLFKNLNLSLSKGHIYGLLGKNGAGKSTLLHNITGLSYPQSGLCTVNGLNSADRLVDFLADMYFIPEEIYVPSVTAARFVKNTGSFYPRFNEQQFYTYLNEFDVPRESILDKLSFGQQKKVMIAFGLATNTSLLVMDEPTNGLDIPSKVQFRKIIASVLTEERCIIISTHQVRDLDSLIDTLVVLHNREIVVNQELDAISEKIYFTTLDNNDTRPALYQEESMRGKNAMVANNENLYSKVDMELLFNAIINGNQQTIDLLKIN